MCGVISEMFPVNTGKVRENLTVKCFRIVARHQASRDYTVKLSMQYTVHRMTVQSFLIML